MARRTFWLEKYEGEMEALHQAEEWLRRTLPDRLPLLELDAPWRLELHTEAQAEAAFASGLEVQP